MSVESVAVRLAHGLSRAAVAIELAGTGGTVTLGTYRRSTAGSVAPADLPAPRVGDLRPVVRAGHERRRHARRGRTLGQEGLVRLIPSPSYAPADVRVELTDSGRAQRRDMLNWAAELLAEIDRLPLGEQATLLRLVLERIVSMQRLRQNTNHSHVRDVPLL